ncbi:hypothetical protein [Mesorhizobium sp.]|uniref:DUF6894 family protein n=1 Tax=Mesorhizobium sp. TaxID=1871066 RepID=UPI0025E43F54|nr:hypothetical protein [Mesorhizobium sp.]
MERFYFDLYNAEHTQMDADGQVLSNPERAAAEALRILHDVARDEMPSGEKLEIAVRVRNEKASRFRGITHAEFGLELTSEAPAGKACSSLGNHPRPEPFRCRKAKHVRRV